MARQSPRLDAPLPRGWPQRVRSAVIHAISPARISLTSARGCAANSINPRIPRFGLIFNAKEHVSRGDSNSMDGFSHSTETSQ